MGYTSDIKMYIRGPESQMTALLVTWRNQGLPGYAEARKMLSIQRISDELRLIVEQEGVKWYHEYPDVSAINKLWDLAYDYEELCGEEVRIGEEDNDIARDSFGDHCHEIYTSRSVYFDFDTLDAKTFDTFFDGVSVPRNTDQSEPVQTGL